MILNIYITMFPLILGGIFNMLFTKTKFYNQYKYPIDCNKNWKDGKRIFGDNKTIIGFISMIVFCIITQVIWGYGCEIMGITGRNQLYLIYENSYILNAIVGFLFGFTYMLFELPNSFIKRRLGIIPGKTDKGLKGLMFFIIDQIDSLIGVFLVLMLFNGMSIWDYFCYLLVGAITHITINLILFWLRIRRNV